MKVREILKEQTPISESIIDKALEKLKVGIRSLAKKISPEYYELYVASELLTKNSEALLDKLDRRYKAMLLAEKDPEYVDRLKLVVKYQKELNSAKEEAKETNDYSKTRLLSKKIKSATPRFEDYVQKHLKTINV